MERKTYDMVGRLLLLVVAIGVAAASLWFLGQISYTHRALGNTVGVIAGVSLGLALVVLLQLGNYRRSATVATAHPDSLVAMVASTPGSLTALQRLRSDDARPVNLTLEVSSQWLSLWRGLFDVEKFVQVPLEDVEAVEAKYVRARVRTFRGLEITLRGQTDRITLPLIVTGAGLAGALPPSFAVLRELALEIMARVDAVDRTGGPL